MEKKETNPVMLGLKDFNNEDFLMVYNPDKSNAFYDSLAAHLGVKRYSEEYNHYLWTKLLGVSEEEYAKVCKEHEEL